MSILRPDLERALREQLPSSVDLRFATTVTHIDNGDDGVRLILSDGSTIEADLLVGADGIHSAVRHMVFGEERKYLRYLGFHTAAYVFEDPEIHSKVRDRFCVTDTVGKQVGFYGLHDGRVAAFTVHRTPDPTLPSDAQSEIRDVYGSLGWFVPQALAQCPPSTDVYYDQVAQIEMPQWSQGRVTLIGDACHAVSLLAGQGASLGMAGAYLLAEQLTRTDSINAGLAQYERIWRPVVEEKQQVARRAVRWFLPESQWQLRVRRTAMRLSGLPGLDRAVAAAVGGKPTAVIRQLS